MTQKIAMKMMNPLQRNKLNLEVIKVINTSHVERNLHHPRKKLELKRTNHRKYKKM